MSRISKLCIFILLLFFGNLCFAQENTNFRIFGRIPAANDQRLYQIQVGAFQLESNAERVHERLRQAALNPVYERFNNLTRVMVAGVNAREIMEYLDIIRMAGFDEVLIRIDNTVLTPITLPPIPSVRSIAELTVSNVVIPPLTRREIASRIIRVGETRSLTDLAEGREITSWTSSTPSTARVDQAGVVTGLSLGNAFISFNENEYISLAVIPDEDFFIVPEPLSVLLPPESITSSESRSLTEYRTEPTFRLAYRFTNMGENRGASGNNGGIDILGRGANYEWLWTTFFQGGWFYNLNGIMREMIDGFQRSPNGVTLTILPEFVYDKGVPYLQLRHLLHNPNNFPVTDQRFGASADVMIHNNDFASLILTPYGAYMTDDPDYPSLELVFICLNGDGITPVDTLWLGTWEGGAHVDYIYHDRRVDVHYADSAIGFSYQDIDLAPGEIKEFIVRFTLARYGD